jgi:hypothetical protein
LLKLLSEGHSYSSAGAELRISVNTVRNYIPQRLREAARPLHNPKPCHQSAARRADSLSWTPSCLRAAAQESAHPCSAAPPLATHPPARSLENLPPDAGLRGAVLDSAARAD